jgi:hypothetical protein
VLLNLDSGRDEIAGMGVETALLLAPGGVEKEATLPAKDWGTSLWCHALSPGQ